LKGYNNLLKKLKFSSNVLPKRIFPETYDNFNNKQKSSFLNGCFSANGSVIKGYRISYKSTCKEFIKKLSNTLKNDFNIDSYITTNKSKKNKFKNGEYKCKKGYDLNISKYKSIKKFYLKINFFQKYKQIQLKNLILERVPYISSIKKNGIKEVYDFKEPLSHWGVIKGYVTHNCGELPLPAGGTCLLGSINLSEIVENPFTDKAKFKMKDFLKIVKKSVTYLNEILEEGIDLHPHEYQKETARNWKPIGLGQMGLGSMLIKMGIKYGSKESLSLCNEIGFTMINAALQQSALLAKEKGTYPKYNEEAILNSIFLKANATDETIDMIKKYGLRNSQLLTTAPTGSISNLVNVSGGIEPIFKTSYTRKTETLHDENTEYQILDNTVKQLMEIKGIEKEENLPNYVVDASNLNYKERIKMQSVWQQYIDSSISSTINLSNDTTADDIKKIYMYAWEQGLKGITIYRDGCAREGILKGKENVEGKTEMTEQDFIDQNICPECQSKLYNTGGCRECKECGFSVCST
jgi:ribonucleoside-diphosphate reductase alpha chain